MYGHPLCKLNVLCDFCWPAGTLAVMSCGSWGTAWWSYPGGMARVEVGMGWYSPKTLHAEAVLTGQLQLKWNKLKGPISLHIVGALSGH